MLGAAIILFRETLEAALLIGVIAAATRTIAQRGRWIGGGILVGLAGACIVAALTGEIAALFEGVGQELFNAAILGVAVLMLAWHSIWMSAHGRELAAAARDVGHAVKTGQRNLSAILIVIALAVLREGSESALFVYGQVSGAAISPGAIAAGAVFGLAGGAALGMLLYAGMLRIPMKWFFSVTNALILLLAAGMASRMAQFLIQADMLPALRTPLWDSSSILPANSALGAFMHALAGYEATPSGMQVLFYVATLVTVLAGTQWTRPAKPSPA
jgi:high-affinity iron transporter